VTFDEGYEKRIVRDDEKKRAEGWKAAWENIPSAGCGWPGPGKQHSPNGKSLTTGVAQDRQGCEPLRLLHASPLFSFLLEKLPLQCLSTTVLAYIITAQ